MIEEKADYHVRHRDIKMYILVSNFADILYFHGNDEVTIWRESTEGSTSFSAGRRTKDWLCPPREGRCRVRRATTTTKGHHQPDNVVVADRGGRMTDESQTPPDNRPVAVA